MFGGAVSGVALLTLAPLLGKISLMFSAPEYFLIVILGLSIIGGLGGGSMIKGFLMGCFGLFLGTIGTDGLTGQLRFTFGIDGLYAGISTVPALIGLFSIFISSFQSAEDLFITSLRLFPVDQLMPPLHIIRSAVPVL